MAEIVEKHERGVRRFGVRYGRTVKHKLGKIEAQQKRAHACPYCHYPKVRRKSAGIWHCTKCGKTFASRAYTVTRPGDVKLEESAEA
jgi:ribosomal protein eL43